jgi:hypothetical protein
VLPATAACELSRALELLRQVQALLHLFGDRAFAAEALSAADAATLVRCSGAVDFAGLDADITAATGRVLGWYRRLVEEPARQALRKAAKTTGDSAR